VKKERSSIKVDHHTGEMIHMSLLTSSWYETSCTMTIWVFSPDEQVSHHLVDTWSHQVLATLSFTWNRISVASGGEPGIFWQRPISPDAHLPAAPWCRCEKFFGLSPIVISIIHSCGPQSFWKLIFIIDLFMRLWSLQRYQKSWWSWLASQRLLVCHQKIFLRFFF
jgi:hypothetical protein